MKAHLLYVEDDESLSFVTRDNLELQGYQITHCATGKDALQLIDAQSQDIDLYILDVMLPDIDGFTIARRIREQDTHTPILFLTAKSLKEDRLKGLRLGADDYITKPFSIEELMLKVEIFLRRSQITLPDNASEYALGQFRFDYQNLLLKGDGEPRQLTQKEADLLRLFAEQRNQVIRRSDILKKLWGEDDYFLGRSLDVFISRLRKYLRKDTQLKIENIHGVGFRLKEGN
ncbi:response regulator transcription factor [Phaeodactylibacter xiamenensis]|jgi:DNA-binding response OmpR family regulator|uniref:response regulator transcription factor n=1 Tax=Phaeodactylibacter xiamenensis TaxID=1524460 RepID=UPI0024A995F0|nr:response regulator transcription factor [Phaeodactylibacter xiamenensis]